MKEASEMMGLEARIAALEAKLANSTQEMNTEELISFPEYDIGTPPNVPIGGGEGGMFNWDPDTRTMGAGGCMVGRTWHGVAAAGSKGDGTYLLKITLGNQSDTVEVVEDSGNLERGENISYIPIYTIADGEIDQDLRGAFVVPCWE